MHVWHNKVTFLCPFGVHQELFRHVRGRDRIFAQRGSSGGGSLLLRAIFPGIGVAVSHRGILHECRHVEYLAELPLQPKLYRFIVDPSRMGAAFSALASRFGLDVSPCSASVARARIRALAAHARAAIDSTPFVVIGAEWYLVQVAAAGGPAPPALAIPAAFLEIDLGMMLDQDDGLGMLGALLGDGGLGMLGALLGDGGLGMLGELLGDDGLGMLGGLLGDGGLGLLGEDGLGMLGELLGDDELGGLGGMGGVRDELLLQLARITARMR